MKAELANLDQAITFLEKSAGASGVLPERIAGLSVALEEAFVNICNYAYPEGSGDINLTCSMVDDDFVLEIIDQGIPFDLLSLAEPDITADIDDRAIGGLGIYLLKKFSDDVTYRREAGCNKLRLLVHGKTIADNRA
jgi:anti-sigma regulatory factor (Ser/Thr protein kinase)